jgi:hypothetical protein
VVIPQLSQQTIRKRAGLAFDRAVQIFYYHFFIDEPPRADMERVRSIAAGVRSGDAFMRAHEAMRRFARERPDSVLSRYFRFLGTAGFLVDPPHPGTGRIAFNRRTLREDVQMALGGLRVDFVESVLALSRVPSARSFTVQTDNRGMDSAMVRQFGKYLGDYLSAPGSTLPVTVALTRTGDYRVSFSRPVAQTVPRRTGTRLASRRKGAQDS